MPVLTDEIQSAQTDQELDVLQTKILVNIKQDQKRFPFLFYKPNDNQLPFHMSPVPERFCFMGNRSGKTTAFVLECMFHATGMYPNWYPEEGKSPARPVAGRYGCTDIKNALTESVLPEFKKWLGVMFAGYSDKTASLSIKHSGGGVSTIKLMSYDSYDKDPDSWESTSLDFACLDEHAPEGAYRATNARLSSGKGRLWGGLTAAHTRQSYWEFEGIFEQEGIRTGLEIFRGNTYSNLHNLSPDYIEKLTRGLDEDEKRVRLYGDFIVLSGRVYKIFDEKIHVVNDFPINDKDYTHYCIIDPHDRTATAVAWAAVDRLGDVYWWTCLFKETYNKTFKEIADMIKDVEGANKITVERRIIDPASEQSKKDEDRPQFDIKGMFANQGIYTIPADHDIPTGHAKVREYLYYDTAKPIDLNNRPKTYFMRDGFREGIYQLKHYVYDEFRFHPDDRDPKEKVKDKNKHIPDLVRYGLMDNLCYFEKQKKFMEFGGGAKFDTYTGRRIG